jgi:hypothetical protein
MAIHRAKPTKIKPSRRPSLSGRNAQARASCKSSQLQLGAEVEDYDFMQAK